MQRRIFLCLFLMAFAVLAACFAVLVPVLYKESVLLQEAKLEQALQTAELMVARDKDAAFAARALPAFRLTHIGPAGDVRFDNRHDPADMDGHGLRSEVKDAVAQGFGQSVRYSDTLFEETAYIARRLQDGSVLRISESRASAFRVAYDLLGWFVLAAMALVGMSLFVSRRIAARIVAPVNALDLEHPLENDTYDELAPMLRRLARQHGQIAAQLASLQKQRDEFEHIVGAMEEGLVLFDTFGRILSINRAACAIFGLDSSCRGSCFPRAGHGSEILSALERAMNDGRAALQLERDGKLYQLDMSRIMSGQKIVGSVLLACDITERAERERRQKEFTANVSHELKTPLQSIIGAAELMSGGLVPQEEMPRFAGKIYRDGQRMAALIADILRLAHLGEGAVSQSELDLAEVARETADRFCGMASEAGISLSCACAGARIQGDRTLIAEIFGNLVDNAVKYNRPGGSVAISTGMDGGHPFLTVADTGIGIDAKEHERIFERFYRVDRSRSRQTGGTGLGLSIVREAARVHKAEIGIRSNPGGGTAITVIFPAEDRG